MENSTVQSNRSAMSCIRRGLAVVLCAVFTLTLLATLVLVRLNGTLLEPRFYPDLVQRVDVYRFVTVDALTTAIDEARRADAGQFGGALRDNPIVTSGLTSPQIAEAVHRGLSPRDLERLTSPVLFQVGEYVRGDRDTLAVSVEADRVRRVAGEIHGLLRESGAYDSLIDRELEPRVREATGAMLGSDGDVSIWMHYLSGDTGDAEDWIVRVVMSSLTADWLAGQVEQALDEFTAYLVGETDSFEITVRLAGAEVDKAVEETKSILREADAYELVYSGVVEPALTDVMGAGVRLPYGVTVTSDEVMGALRQAAPPSWVQEHAENLIDHVGPYVVGASDDFSVEIDLARNKQQAAEALTDLALDDALEALSTLSFCDTTSEATTARRRLEQGLPQCLPPGTSLNEVLGLVETGIDDSVHTFVLAPIPDTVTFDEVYLRSALEQTGGPEALERLDYIRAVMDDGWTYTHQDLRADLSARGDALTGLDDVRSFFRDGYSHTYQASSDQRATSRAGAALDGARARLEVVSRYEWPVYLLTSALLIFISMLGGTSWRSRVIWASSTVLISAGLIYILSWPMQQPVADAAAEQARAEVGLEAGGIFSGTIQLIDAKVGEISHGVAIDIVSGVRLYSLVLAGAAAVVLLTALFWLSISESPLRRNQSTVYGPCDDAGQDVS